MVRIARDTDENTAVLSTDERSMDTQVRPDPPFDVGHRDPGYMNAEGPLLLIYVPFLDRDGETA